ncbi:MAG: PAS domain-containing protein, partial [Oscillospiraceae bacterium]|nr:PAS domain-containing protein [Oscillospiraceae bacterium]
MLNFKTGFYERLFRSLDNNAVLMRVEDGGVCCPIWCSREFAEMMEGTEADFVRLEHGGTMRTIHPDDREEVAYLFRHHRARDGSNSLTLRKITVKGREIWVKVHYAFVEEDGAQYVYCTYADITETKKRERVAEIARRERESLRLLHGMLNSGPWYMDFDEQGNMTSVTWSDTFRRMLGYQDTSDFPDVLESWSDLLHREDRDRVLKEYTDTVHDYTGQKTYDVEYRLLTKNRGWRWFHAVGQLSRRPDGSPVTYVGMFVDITEQKELQQKLEEREREKTNYNSLMDQFNAIADESLTVIRSNMTTGRIEEVRGRDLYPTDYAGNAIEAYAASRLQNLLVESDRKKYVEVFMEQNLLERAAKGLGPATLVCYCRRASGRRCFVKFSGSASRNPLTGDVDAFGMETEYNAEMVTEVMNRKILAQQYDMVTYIISGYYGVAIGDAGRISRGSISPKQRDGVYADYLREQVLPAVPEAKRGETARALDLDTVAARLMEQDSYTVDVTCEIDGGIYNKQFTFYMADREREFYILLKSDMTDVLREQTARNDILASALREAEQANAAKTAFLSTMSHEIRTPMNAIIGLDSIALKDPALPARIREYLEKIGGSARHLLSLINDILDMSRIESGRMVLKNQEFSLSSMLEQINTMINGQCADRGLQYDCRILGAVDHYYIGDDVKLKQVLLNILGNAVKFTPAPGTVTFLVERTAQYGDQSTLRFTVRDTGIGMDRAFLPRLFETFSQEDAATTNKYGGTGLGMAITKNIVEMMNGSITVESEKGAGTTFTVTVTLKNSGRTARPAEELKPQNLRVLVIDDDPIACEHAKLVLEEAGISADTSLSGADALRKIEIGRARRRFYDLILVDLKMPEQDGLEVTRRVRQLYQDESTIIILTAYSWDDIAGEALE